MLQLKNGNILKFNTFLFLKNRQRQRQMLQNNFGRGASVGDKLPASGQFFQSDVF